MLTSQYLCSGLYYDFKFLAQNRLVVAVNFVAVTTITSVDVNDVNVVNVVNVVDVVVVFIVSEITPLIPSGFLGSNLVSDETSSSPIQLWKFFGKPKVFFRPCFIFNLRT